MKQMEEVITQGTRITTQVQLLFVTTPLFSRICSEVEKSCKGIDLFVRVEPPKQGACPRYGDSLIYVRIPQVQSEDDEGQQEGESDEEKENESDEEKESKSDEDKEEKGSEGDEKKKEKGNESEEEKEEKESENSCIEDATKRCIVYYGSLPLVLHVVDVNLPTEALRVKGLEGARHIFRDYPKLEAVLIVLTDGRGDTQVIEVVGSTSEHKLQPVSFKEFSLVKGAGLTVPKLSQSECQEFLDYVANWVFEQVCHLHAGSSLCWRLTRVKQSAGQCTI